MKNKRKIGATARFEIDWTHLRYRTEVTAYHSLMHFLSVYLVLLFAYPWINFTGQQIWIETRIWKSFYKPKTKKEISLKPSRTRVRFSNSNINQRRHSNRCKNSYLLCFVLRYFTWNLQVTQTRAKIFYRPKGSRAKRIHRDTARNCF